MDIRRMKEEDLNQVLEIEQECFSEPWSANVYRQTLQNKNAFYLVAEESTSKTNLSTTYVPHIIGICGMMNILGEADISNVAVDARFRKRGIAYAMLKELFQIGCNLKIQKYFLEVRASNRAAILLYEKCNFQKTGRRKSFYEKPTEDAIIMTKEMNNTD